MPSSNHGSSGSLEWEIVRFVFTVASLALLLYFTTSTSIAIAIEIIATLLAYRYGVSFGAATSCTCHKKIESRRPLNILDLPPEIRQRIFDFALLRTDKKRDRGRKVLHRTLKLANVCQVFSADVAACNRRYIYNGRGCTPSALRRLIDQIPAYDMTCAQIEDHFGAIMTVLNNADVCSREMYEAAMFLQIQFLSHELAALKKEVAALKNARRIAARHG